MSNNKQTFAELRRVMEIFSSSEGEIRPHFILTGPSGSGKSHAIEHLVGEMGLEFMDVNAAQLTKEGTSGNSLSKAMMPLAQKAGQLTVCFVDEFDKLFVSGNSNGELAHETTNGVQNEFLRVLESSQASIFGDFGKYHQVPCDNVLFVFAGAFNGEENVDIDRLRDFGIKTEFLGRVGITFAMEKMTLEEMEDILDHSPLLHCYLELFTDVKRSDVTTEIMAVVRDNYEKNTLGVRLINTLIHQYFIHGGIQKKEAKKVSFQSTLTLN